MCGRFGQTATAAELAAAFEAAWRHEAPADLPRFNIAPTQDAPVLRMKDGVRVLDAYRWGLIPSWAKDASIGARMINARAESVLEKPAFRAAFERRRCLVPASGFYEWRKTAAGKVPQWIYPVDGAPLTFAGLWEFWKPVQDAEPVLTFTILTTTPSADVAMVHDRMPVVVAPADRNAWLDKETREDALAALLRPAPDGSLRMHAVSTAVNRATNEGPALIEPVEPEPDLFPGDPG